MLSIPKYPCKRIKPKVGCYAFVVCWIHQSPYHPPTVWQWGFSHLGLDLGLTWTRLSIFQLVKSEPSPSLVLVWKPSLILYPNGIHLFGYFLPKMHTPNQIRTGCLGQYFVCVHVHITCIWCTHQGEEVPEWVYSFWCNRPNVTLIIHIFFHIWRIWWNRCNVFYTYTLIIDFIIWKNAETVGIFHIVSFSYMNMYVKSVIFGR